MGVLGILGAVFGFADTALSYLSEKERLKYRDKLYNLKKSISDEQMKPLDEQDDVRLENWYLELPLILEAINVQMQLQIDRDK